MHCWFCVKNFLKGYFRTCLIIVVAFNRTNPRLTMQQIISISIGEEDAVNGWCVSVLWEGLCCRACLHYLVYGELCRATAFLKWNRREELRAVMGSGVGMPGMSSRGNEARWGAGLGSSCEKVLLWPLPRFRDGERNGSGEEFSAASYCSFGFQGQDLRLITGAFLNKKIT